MPYLFYSVWLIVALLQANYTELLSDEAYYWKYSQFLDWGYFDHPPMVALLIKIGTSIFSGELGVRLLFTLVGTGTIYIIEKLVNPRNRGLFYVILSSVGLLYFTSVFALADVPLLFFTALFFYLLKLYLKKSTISLAVLLGVTTACLLLSKYHGFVIIFIALISNLQLLKKGQFYMIILTALVLVIPHFLWQVNNDFPSIQYHFHDRNLDAYSISNTLNFVGIQLVLFGPFIGIILWISFFRTTIKSQFDKVLYWQVIGVLIFFFLLTFNGKVQGHWTGILIIPLVYFGYHYLNDHIKLKKIAFYQWPIAVVLVLIVKLGLVINLPFGDQFNQLFNDYKGHQKWAKAIQSKTGELPVVFMNSYQNASKFEFYTKQKAITISNVMSRKNQYNLWQFEDSLRGETIALIPNYIVKEFETIDGISPLTHFGIINNFQYYSQVELVPKNWKKRIKTRDSLKVSLEMIHSDAFSFTENADYPSYISYVFFEDNNYISQHKTAINCATVNRQDISLKMNLPEKKGTYQVYFSIKTGRFPVGLNSRVYELILE